MTSVLKKCDFFPVWRARSGSGGNRPWIVGLFSSDWTSYDFASEASSRVRPNPIASHRARSLRASAPRATVRQRDVGRCQLFGACAPNPVTNPSRPPDRSLEMAAWLAPSIRSPTGNGSSPGTACVSIARQATTRSTSRPRAPTSRAARARVPRTSRYAPLAPRAPPPPAPDRSLSVRRVAEKISSPLDRSAGVLAHRRYVYLKSPTCAPRSSAHPSRSPFSPRCGLSPSPLPQTHPPWNPRLRFPRLPRPDTTPPTRTTPPLAACTQAKAREAVYMKATKYIEGKKQPSVVTEVIPPGGK